MVGCSHMSSITSTKTIETLQSVFAIHGLPRVVMDNGSSFTSEEFKMFVHKNAIKHVTSALYHPSTNGQVERAVQTLKRGLKCTPGNSVQEKLSRFLFGYRTTPHTTTGVPPCEMLMNRRLRLHLDLFHPEISGKVENHRAKQKELHDQRSLRQFTENDKVYMQDFTTRKPRWIPGTVVQVTGPLSYMIKLQDGATVRRHVDHVREKTQLLTRILTHWCLDLNWVVMRPPNLPQLRPRKSQKCCFSGNWFEFHPASFDTISKPPWSFWYVIKLCGLSEFYYVILWCHWHI